MVRYMIKQTAKPRNVSNGRVIEPLSMRVYAHAEEGNLGDKDRQVAIGLEASGVPVPRSIRV